ncbi:MAG: hypothetical protein KGO49_06145 [Gammaproteobacteria bacterium]|nr:hypothetical protein [Gammaproteobacteria bacterium]
MDILVVLGVLVAVILILIGLYMMIQPKFAANSVAKSKAAKVSESIPVAAPQIESDASSVSEPAQIAPVISANDFITQTINQHNHQQARIHPTLDERAVDVESSESPAFVTPQLDIPVLVNTESEQLAATSHADEKQDYDVQNHDVQNHSALDAMLDDLAQATTIEEMGRHGDIISDLNQVYDSLMPHTVVSPEALAQVIETRQLAEWEGESALINDHLAEHTRSEEDSILVQAEQIIAIHLLPKSGRPLEGRTVLRLLRKYGLRFGEMDLFHRFEEATGEGAMMFSVLKYTQEGPAGFDLDTMEQENFDGLSFFLALPGIKPLQGFDMMMSTAQRLSQECYAHLLDDEMNLLSEQLKGHYRHQVLDFRPSR